MGVMFLVVDDSQLYRTTFCMLLQSCWPDAQIGEAVDGSSALAMVAQQPWDAILLDYQLPTLSGGELIRLMRARVGSQGKQLAPLVLMSSQPDVAYFTRALGAVAFLPKPVGLAELRTTLAPYVHNRAPSQRANILLPGAASAQNEALVLPVRQAKPGAPPTLPSAPRATSLPAPASATPQRIWISTTRSQQLQSTINDLFLETIRCYPPPYPAAISGAAPEAAYRVGEYLEQLGYVTPRQLTRAVQLAQHGLRRGQAPLGRILVTQDLVPSPVLIAVLLQQFSDRMARESSITPRFLGENLLLGMQITPAQLALALHEQLEHYRQGSWMRLGALIVRHGWISSTTLRGLVREPNQPA